MRTPIPQGAHLTSWGLPFGIASRALGSGEYVCNAKILTALAERDIDFELPASANFTDTIETCALDEASFIPGEQVERIDSGAATFDGFRRPGRRGVGTRNFVVVLATTSRVNGFVLRVAERAATLAPAGVDGVVAVTHTKGGGTGRPNNLDHVLRVLAGFMVHPNVGAVLAADDSAGSYTGDDVRRGHVRGVHRCRLQTVYQPRLRIHTDMRLHPEIPLIPLLRLVHLRVPLPHAVLRPGRRGHDARIHHRPRLQPMPPGRPGAR